MFHNIIGEILMQREVMDVCVLRYKRMPPLNDRWPQSFDRKALTATKGKKEEMEFDNICTFYNQITQFFGCFSVFMPARLFTESRRASEPLLLVLPNNVNTCRTANNMPLCYCFLFKYEQIDGKVLERKLRAALQLYMLIFLLIFVCQ